MLKSAKLTTLVLSFFSITSLSVAGTITCKGSVRNQLSVEVSAFSSAYGVGNPKVKIEGELIYAENLPEVGTPDAQFAKKAVLTDKWHSEKFLGLRIAFPEAGDDVAIFESSSVELTLDSSGHPASAKYKGVLKVRTNPEAVDMMSFENTVCTADFDL